MSDYICNQSFKAKDGKFYSYGEKIHEARFKLLSNFEQRKFSKAEKVNSYSPKATDDSFDFLDSQKSNYDVPTTDWDSTSFNCNDTNQDFDFGGGDSGGAGASGDY